MFKDNPLLDPEYSFELDPSSASCSFKDINGYVYGGLSSRFWMHRAHINSTDYSNL